MGDESLTDIITTIPTGLPPRRRVEGQAIYVSYKFINPAAISTDKKLI